MNAFGQKLLRWYLNSLGFLVFAFVGLNLFFGAVISVLHFKIFQGKRYVQVATKYGQERLQKAYPKKTWDEVLGILEETWARHHHTFQPYVQFRENTYKGKYLNVSKNGYREIGSALSWPPDSTKTNIFFFGGSTTFGYGVEDTATIPAHFSRLLKGDNTRVYNFGCGYYFQTQERILLENMLEKGIKPDLAIFIDGLNDFFPDTDDPNYTDYLSGVMVSEHRLSNSLSLVLSALPISRLTNPLIGLTRHYFPDLFPSSFVAQGTHDEIVARRVTRYISSVKIADSVGKAFGVKTMFIQQPVPFVSYDPNGFYAAYQEAEAPLHPYMAKGYEKVSSHAKQGDLGKNFVPAAEWHHGLNVPLYVDGVHYSDEFSAVIAENIRQNAVRLNLLKNSPREVSGK